MGPWDADRLIQFRNRFERMLVERLKQIADVLTWVVGGLGCRRRYDFLEGRHSGQLCCKALPQSLVRMAAECVLFLTRTIGTHNSPVQVGPRRTAVPSRY